MMFYPLYLWLNFWFSYKPRQLPRAQVIFFTDWHKESIKKQPKNINERGRE